MQPTLQENEVLILNKRSLIRSKINRFDIVVIRYSDETIIKRVIGLPGEKVEYLDNVLYVNGEIVKDESVSFINNEHVLRTIKKMLQSSNIKMDNSKVIETTLPDGSMLNVVLPPISLRGPILNIK